MNSRRLVNPQLLGAIGHFFPATCTIQANGPAQDEHGQPIEIWTAIPGKSNIPCRVAPSTSPSGREVKTGTQTYVMSTHTIALKGHWDGISETMRAVVGSNAYDILQVRDDSQGYITWLTTEIVR